MNVRRFTARSSRDALVLVRQALGEDAVVLSTKPCVDGVEVLAMAPEGMKQIERMAASVPVAAAPAKSLAERSAARAEAAVPASEVAEDVARLSMSTLSFQDYVRERMLRRRQAALAPKVQAQAQAPMPVRDEPSPLPAPAPERSSMLEQRMSAPAAAPLLREPPVLRDALPAAPDLHLPVMAEMAQATAAGHAAARRDQEDMMNELRSMKGLIEERFGALAFMEKLNRQPAQARLTHKLLEGGF